MNHLSSGSGFISYSSLELIVRRDDHCPCLDQGHKSRYRGRSADSLLSPQWQLLEGPGQKVGSWGPWPPATSLTPFYSWGLLQDLTSSSLESTLSKSLKIFSGGRKTCLPSFVFQCSSDLNVHGKKSLGSWISSFCFILENSFY